MDTLGDRKTALFLIISDTDGTFNFLISMIYSQLFNLLCEKKYLNHRLRLRKDDVFTVVDVDAAEKAAEQQKHTV